MTQNTPCEYRRLKMLTKERAEFLNEIQKMTKREIYDKYGYQRDEAVIETVDFDNGVKMDIYIVMPLYENDTPILYAILCDETGAILAENNDIDDVFDDCAVEFDGNNTYPAGIYTVILKAVENCETDNSSDNVNHPVHYQGKYECIDEMIALFGVDAVKNFCKCNVYKYRYRADRKNGQEDIAKAEWYMSKLMELEKCDDKSKRGDVL